MTSIVIYHEDCIDGLASAWVLHRKQDDTAPIYIPYGHHNIATAEDSIRAALTPDAKVFFVDVAPTRAFLDELTGRNIFVRIIDHHKSAGVALAGYPPSPTLDIRIEEGHPSAANLVWEIFFPDRQKPAFLTLIAKMDIAIDLTDKNDLAAAATINSYSIRSTDDAFASFAVLEKLSYQDLVNSGRDILRDQDTRITKLDDNIMFTPLVMDGCKTLWIPIVNADVQNFGRQISDYLRGHGDAAGHGVAFAWYMQGNGTVTMSVRAGSGFDASAIVAALAAKIPGLSGGGHKTSAAAHFTSLAHFVAHIKIYSKDQMKADTA